MIRFLCPNCGEDGDVGFDVLLYVRVDAATQNVDPGMDTIDLDAANPAQVAHCFACARDFTLADGMQHE